MVGIGSFGSANFDDPNAIALTLTNLDVIRLEKQIKREIDNLYKIIILIIIIKTNKIIHK